MENWHILWKTTVGLSESYLTEIETLAIFIHIVTLSAPRLTVLKHIRSSSYGEFDQLKRRDLKMLALYKILNNMIVTNTIYLLSLNKLKRRCTLKKVVLGQVYTSKKNNLPLFVKGCLCLLGAHLRKVTHNM